MNSHQQGTEHGTARKGPTITEGTANHPQNKNTKLKEVVAKAFQQEVAIKTHQPSSRIK
jgi:hypothetical protein